MPRARKVVCTTPEQSTPHGVTPPHSYGEPAKYSSAQRSGGLARAACTASAAQASAPSATCPRRPSGRRTVSPSSATRARSGSRTAGPSPSRTAAPRLQPVASRRQASALRVVHLDAVAGVHPALVAVEIGAHAPPVGGGLEHGRGLAEDELARLLGAEGRLREDRHDGGARDDRGHDGAASLAAHSRQSVTPRKLQMRQMNVPQLAQG